MVDHILKAKKQLKFRKDSAKPYYTDTPQVPQKKITKEVLVKEPSLGNSASVPGIVPTGQGKSSALGLGAPQKRPTHGFGHPVAQQAGPLRISGHKGSHRIGFSASKSKIR